MLDNLELKSAIFVLLIDKLWNMFFKRDAQLKQAIDSLNETMTRVDTTIKYFEKRLDRLESKR